MKQELLQSVFFCNFKIQWLVLLLHTCHEWLITIVSATDATKQQAVL
jgi:hypothetical protein